MKKKVHLIKIKDKCVDPGIYKEIFDSIDEYLNDDGCDSLKLLGHNIEIQTVEMNKGDQFYVVNHEADIFTEDEMIIKDVVQ